MWQPDGAERRLARGVRTRIGTTIGYGGELARWSWEDLPDLIGPAELELLALIRELDPGRFGVTVPRRSIDPIPADLRLVGHQAHHPANGVAAAVDAYLPAGTYPAVVALNRAISVDLGRPLNVRWGYRSPACQVALYVWLLVELQFDVARVGRCVLPPAYSPHCWSAHGSVDFMATGAGSLTAGFEDFSETAEYRWLTERAHEFGFVETWPRDNPAGLEFEPWDWRFTG
jgi:hypothetical protein